MERSGVMTRGWPAAVLAGLLAFGSASSVRAVPYDGRYVGSISCAAIPGQTRGPLQTAFSMTVAAGQARYEREVMRPDDTKAKLGVTEQGTGTVSSDGEVSLTGSAGRADWSYQASYQGRSERAALRLSGIQIWRLPGRSAHERACTVTLSRKDGG